MTYTVIDNKTNYVTRGKDCFVIQNLSVPEAAFVKDSTLIDKGLKYPNEFINAFALAFKDIESHHVILSPEAHENMMRIMSFNREDC